MTNKNIEHSELHFKKSELIDMVGDNEEFINLLISTFIEGYHKYVKNIHQALKDKNAASLKLNAHSITGSARSVCFPIMAQLAAELEILDINDEEHIIELLEDVENEFEIIIEIVNKV